MLSILLILLSLTLMSSKPIDRGDEEANEFTSDDVERAIMALHTSKNGRALIWQECGKRLNKKAQELRAAEYREAIMASVDDVEARKGFRPDPRIMVAILFRESSNDECVIGKQETDKLAEQLGRQPVKSELLDHVKKWGAAKGEASRWCRKDGKLGDCVSKYIGEHYPHYRGIRGWDIGAPQYRWPSASLRNRTVMLSDGSVVEAKLPNLFRYDVGIQLLAEDLAEHHRICQGHTHWLKSKWGKRLRKLSTSEAYYVHHHTGSYRWSEKYWKRIRRHLRVIDSVKSISVANITRIQTIMEFRRIL